jgi:hypothetical protein
MMVMVMMMMMEAVTDLGVDRHEEGASRPVSIQQGGFAAVEDAVTFKLHLGDAERERGAADNGGGGGSTVK